LFNQSESILIIHTWSVSPKQNACRLWTFVLVISFNPTVRFGNQAYHRGH